ncbi:hypothetical protein EYF80_045135 [Liparis tanakae]|uniref:Uncharacterized protein n=1 Tax=Liparis tanakae TaxID=230148 RepID=A0A4Z2FU51_9TELE|nr:hypothetical protein EYF80_045135 [Liparis tanakae]
MRISGELRPAAQDAARFIHRPTQAFLQQVGLSDVHREAVQDPPRLGGNLPGEESDGERSSVARHVVFPEQNLPRTQALRVK